MWHIFYIVLIIGGSVLLAYLYRDKSRTAKTKLLRFFGYLVPTLYVLDFLIMPLARTDFSIDVDKLPFHICTVMAFFVPMAQFNRKFRGVKDVIATLTLVASLMYITYPGSAIGDILPWCYKIIQTFAYHGAMFAWGFLSVAIGGVKLEFKRLGRVAVAVALIIAWAAFGNLAYSEGGWGHGYDWFFITGSTFPFVPTYLMPLTVFIAIMSMCAIVTAIYHYAVKILEKSDKSTPGSASKKEEKASLKA